MRRIALLTILILVLASCKQNDKGYSFFVAGHTYGSPGADNPGVHPPFLAEFTDLNEDSCLQFGIFSGDIVRKSDTASWDAVDRQLEELNKKVYFCPGNHDTYNRELYESRYGKTYYSFQHARDLFIILDGSLDRWNISGAQLEFFMQALGKAQNDIENVFVVIHQLVWWDEHNIFSEVDLNWPPYTPDTTNYWGEIEPLLQECPSPVYILAGDLGASTKASPLMYYPDRNITYIGSGMGSIEFDNYLIIRSEGKGKVKIEIVALGPDPERLGEIEDYILSDMK